MDTRADLQRLLDDMDKVIQAKREELVDLDNRLDNARSQLSEREAQELAKLPDDDQLSDDVDDFDDGVATNQGKKLSQAKKRQLEGHLLEQRQLYERQLEQFGEELSEFEIINQQLLEENHMLKGELTSMKVNFEKLKDGTRLLNESLEEVRSANLELNLRLAQAENENRIQQKLLKKLHHEDEILMRAFNDKLESLKKAIDWRDEEIKRLTIDYNLTLESVGMKLEGVELTNWVTNRNDDKSLNEDETVGSRLVMNFVRTIRDKDTQIESLKAQLLKASASHKGSYLSTEENETQDESREENLSDAQAMLNHYRIVAKKLDAMQLHLIEFRKHQYELYLPNVISDGQDNDNERFNPIQADWQVLLNIEHDLNSKLNKLISELDLSKNLLFNIQQLKQINEVDHPQMDENVNSINQASFKTVKFEEELQQKDGSINLISVTNSNSTDDNNVETKNETKVDDVGGREEIVSNQPVDIKSLPTIETKGNENIADHSTDLVTNDPSATELFKMSTREQNEYDETKCAQQNSSLLPIDIAKPPRHSLTYMKNKKHRQSTTDELKADSSHLLKLETRIEQLKDENELLELAMKEILLSIKHSDSKCSTILIDCPSLERLCQLIEAKFITYSEEHFDSTGSQTSEQSVKKQQERSNMFQLIVLKSELDLVRGQNEQLRGEAKLRHTNFQEFLAKMRPQIICETGNQTEPIDSLTDHDDKNVQEMKVTQQEPTYHNSEKCKNCSKLTNLTNHLLQCIISIESRVNISDETYLNRLIGLHKLNQMLERDLSAQERLLLDMRKQYHVLNQQKKVAEKRLQFFEAQLNVHMKTCPLVTSCYQTSVNLQMFNNPKNQNENSMHTKLNNASMTISLLQSIIDCLQSRLDYKDERLNQLESLLSQQNMQFHWVHGEGEQVHTNDV